MEQYLKANVDSIDSFAKVIKESSDTIDMTLDKIIKLTDEMDKFFNTPTGKNVKETMLLFLDNMRKENSDLLTYSGLINNASVLYSNTMKSIFKSVGGE